MTREEAINVLNDYDINFERHTAEEVAEAHEMAIEVLEQQPNEDCISRKAVLDSLHSCFAEGFNEDRWWNSTHVLDTINEVPSIQPQSKEEPQQKTGHWIEHKSDGYTYIKCSECSCYFPRRLLPINNYCPYCGAKMQEEKK